MSDDLKKKGEPDRSRINIHEPWEVEYWTKRLGCTPAELKQAVKDSGSTSVEKVKKQLNK